MVDSLIRLFESTATSFQTNGLGGLSDALKCEVVEERNGSFELEMEYHISGKRYPDLKLRRIIVAKSNPYSEPQPFRIYDISKPINGLVTIKAEHISYDMTGYPVLPFSVSDVKAAISNAQSNSIVQHPFKLSTDMRASGEFEILKPVSMRSLLGGSSESILESYGGNGEYEFNGFNVILHQNRGTNRGVTIRYGKNMTDLKQEENCSNVYTAVYPFWYSDEWGMIELPEKTLKTAGTYDYMRILPLDLSNDWENSYEWDDQYPSEDEIRELTQKYIDKNNLGVPIVSLTVSFEQLSQTKEYEMMALLETVRLCDMVNVEFPLLGVSAISKCIKTTYNAITNKYISIDLGESQSTLSDTVSEQSQTIKKQPTQTFMEKAIQTATQLISGGLGGYVVIRSSSGGKYPDEILIMDDPQIEKATKVWRWNKGGLGYSPTGYNGPYTTAITQDGSIVADFINTGHLTASIIQGGTFTVGGFDNTNGNIEVRDAQNNLLIQIDVNGMRFYGEGSKPITNITEDTIKTTNVTARNLKVKSANIEGVLTIGQLPDDVAVTDDIPTDEEITVITNNTIKTTNVKAQNLRVEAAHIEGGLTIGQLPDDVTTSDEVVTIIDGTVTSSYMIAKQIEAYSVAAENITGRTISGKTISGGRIEGATIEGGTISISGNGKTTSMNSDGVRTFYIYDNYGQVAMDTSGTKNQITFFNGTSVSNSKINTGTVETLKAYLSGSSDTTVGIRPLTDNDTSCGSGSYKWSNVYCKNASNNTSDRKEKNSIQDIPEKYEKLFYQLKPVIYKFNNGDRIHIGAISQDVEETMKEIGLTDLEVGAFCKDRKIRYKTDDNGKQTEEIEFVFDENGQPVYSYGLRYGEFVMLNTHMLQKAYKKIESQQNQIDKLTSQMNKVLTYLKMEGSDII